MSATSLPSRPPSFAKNLSPFFCHGRWLAVIITETSAPKSSCSSMNMEGVEESPVSMTLPPQAVYPSVTSAQMCSAERRESCPTASVGHAFPVLFCAQTKNAFAMAVTASSVRVTGSFSTPASAAPRTSVPLRKFKKSCSFMIPPRAMFSAARERKGRRLPVC